MWSDGVVEVLELGEGGRSLGDGEFAGVEGPEFGPGGVVGALDAAVGLWGSWREDEEWELEVAACGFELGHELGAAVDLDGLDPGVLGEQRFEESAGVAGGGAGEDEAEHELGGRADGAELLGGLSVAGDGHVVDLDEFAGRGGAHAGGEARGVAAGEVAAPLRRGPSAEERAGAYVPERGLRLFAASPASPPSRQRRFQRCRVALDQPTASRAVASEQPSERSRSYISILRSRSSASGGVDSSTWMARWERCRLE